MPRGYEHGNRVGRPRKTIDPEQVLRLAKQGLTIGEIARVLGMAASTLARQIKSNPELLHQVETAYAAMLAEMTQALRKRALSGHAPSLKLLLERLDRNRLR